MRAHGYGYKAVAFALNVSGRFVRQIYFEAGRPQYHTAADFARLLGVDRSTVLRHATARKEGRTWRIDEIHYRKKYPKFSKAYTEDEIEFIRSHPYWTAQKIAERIGRTACSVRIKKCRLKK
jgi:predicted transcriptional regulator